MSARGNAAAIAEILCSRDPWRFVFILSASLSAERSFQLQGTHVIQVSLFALCDRRSLLLFVRWQGTNAVYIFLFAPCNQAAVLLIRSPARNQCDSCFVSLQTESALRVMSTNNIVRLVIIEKNNVIQLFSLRTGENPYDAAIIFGPDPGRN